MQATAVAMLWLFAGAAPARADAVMMWNQTLLTVIEQSSIAWVNGPPEVAREMAIVDNSMFNAVNDATGGTYTSYGATVGPTAGASVDAAALAAGYTAMLSIFSPVGTPGNPLPAGSNSIGNLWSLARPQGVGTGVAASIISEINTAYTDALSGLGSPTPAIVTGLALGNQDASIVTTSRLSDGAYAAIQNGLLNNAPPGSGTVPGVYVPPSASGGRPEMLPTWSTVTPFGSTAAAALPAIIASAKPLGYNITDPSQLQALIQSPQYASALLETECQGSGTALPANIQTACNAAGYALTPEQHIAQTTSALFWNDPGSTFQPPGHWLQITDTVAASQGLSELQEGRLSALVSTAEADAGIGAWSVKYQANLWRPITAITDCSNWSMGAFTTCDPTWTSVIATPPHPDYLAGHPAFSGAAATVLEGFFGNDNIAFSSTSNTYCNGGTSIFDATGLVTGCTLKGVTYTAADGGCNVVQPDGTNNSPLICPITETFDSFTDASSGPFGAEFSRVVGGIHTPFAVTDALTAGNEIGALTIESNFTPVPEPPAMVVVPMMLGVLGLARRKAFFFEKKKQKTFIH